MAFQHCSCSALFLICILSLFSTCMSSYSKAESIEISKAPNISNDIKSDHDDAGGGRMNVDGKKDREDPSEICSVHRQVCSIHYSLSILGYSLLNYESKPVLPSKEAFASENNHPREDRDGKQEERVWSGNPTLSERTQTEQEGNGQMMNKVSTNDELGSEEDLFLTANEELNIDEKENVIKDRSRLEDVNKSGEQKTCSLPSMKCHQKVMDEGAVILLLQAITLLLESCLSWSFCTFIVGMYSVMKLGKKKERNSMQTNNQTLERSKSTISRDFVQTCEAVRGENEQDFDDESTHEILNEILMKVRLMDAKSELVVNALLRILFIWKSLIKEVITAREDQKEEKDENSDESAVNPVEEYGDDGINGQSILDVSDSYLVPDFSSSDEENDLNCEDQVVI